MYVVLYSVVIGPKWSCLKGSQIVVKHESVRASIVMTGEGSTILVTVTMAVRVTIAGTLEVILGHTYQSTVRCGCV